MTGTSSGNSVFKFRMRNNAQMLNWEGDIRGGGGGGGGLGRSYTIHVYNQFSTFAMQRIS